MWLRWLRLLPGIRQTELKRILQAAERELE